jgi:hypothetical protein
LTAPERLPVGPWLREAKRESAHLPQDKSNQQHTKMERRSVGADN